MTDAVGGKIVTISNEKSSYYQEKAKVLKYLDNEEVEVFLLKKEIIVYLNANDIADNSKVFIPRSRKDYYQYIQDVRTCRKQVIKTTQALIQKGQIKILANYSEDELLACLQDEDKDKSQLVDDFRTLRNEGKLEFLLPNVTFEPKKKPFKKNFNR